MNAYELAEWLDRRREAYEPNGWASDMLRQQADRIADLEKEKIRAYDNGYEDGWKSNTQLHPLSDEEINALGHELIDVEYFDEGEYGMQSNIYGLVEFARAIEERHGIK